jgi:hypothetical protein
LHVGLDQRVSFADVAVSAAKLANRHRASNREVDFETARATPFGKPLSGFSPYSILRSMLRANRMALSSPASFCAPVVAAGGA